MKLRLDRSRVWKQIQEQQRPANLLIQSQLTQSKQLPNVGKFSLVTQSSFFNSPLKKKKKRDRNTHTQTHTTDTRTSTRTERKWDILAEQTIWRYTPARRPQRNWGSNTIATRVTKRANENFGFFYFLLEGWGGGSNGGMGGGGKKMKRRRKKRRRRKW